jgi:hypothetical protein
MHTTLLSENLKGRDRWEILGIDRRIISEWILVNYGWKGVDWMDMVQDMEQCWAPVNTVMNL